MGNYPGSEVEVTTNEEPKFMADLSAEVVSDLFGILSILASAAVVWFTRKLKERVNEISKKVENQVVNFDEIIPKEEVVRVKEILSQLAVIYEADRVTLGVFHNGVIGARGARYDKIALITGYSSPGVIPLPELYKDVDVATLMEDFKPLYEDVGRNVVLSKENAPYSCSLYMTRRDIFHLWNRFLTQGNIDIGILSFHWCSHFENLPIPPEGSRGDRISKELIKEIISIIQISKDRKRILG